VSSDTASTTRWHFAAALAAWLVPGLGHWLIGQRYRGSILMVTLLLLWAVGLTVGGIGVIDHKTHPYWFTGQMLAAPSVVVDWYHQRLKGHGGPQPESRTGRPPAYEPSFGRIREQGTLYVALAGLLNLVAIIDVIYRDPEDPRHRPPGEASEADSAGQEAGSEASETQ
jgi:hypothetical protein